MPKTLTFMRHGHYNTGTKSLSRVGRLEALETGERLLSRDFDLIMHSPVPRAVQTARIVQAAAEGRISFNMSASEISEASCAIKMEKTPWLHDRDESMKFRDIKELPESANSVCFIAHQPNMHLLIDKIFPNKLLRRDMSKAFNLFYKTGVAMTVEFEADEWSKIKRRKARPVRMSRPHGKEESDVAEELHIALKNIANDLS